MTQSTGPIVPTTPQEIQPRGITPANIVVHQHHYHGAPAPVERPSHYKPVPMQDSGLAEVAKWGAGCLVALLCTWLLGSAIIHQSNSNYWANERQLQIIRNNPGGQW